jgi:hypothetical protein
MQLLVSEHSASFGEQDAECVVALPVAHTPEVVVPVVAFDQRRGVGAE